MCVGGGSSTPGILGAEISPPVLRTANESHVSHRNRRADLQRVPDSAIVFFRISGAGRQGSDAASGELIFNNACRTCHTTREGDNRLGPHLHKIIGRKAGSLPNYGYSSAMKGADFIWDKEKLARFIANPDEMVPGNSMKPYGGLSSADNRAKVIAFLQSLTSGQ